VLPHLDEVAAQQIGRILDAVLLLQVGTREGEATAAHGRRATDLRRLFQQRHPRARRRGFERRSEAGRAAAAALTWERNARLTSAVYEQALANHKAGGRR